MVGNIIVYENWYEQWVYAKIVDINELTILVQTSSDDYVMLFNDKDLLKVVRHKEERPILKVSEVIEGLTLGTLKDQDGAYIVRYCVQSKCGEKEYKFIRDVLYKKYEEFFKDAVFD